MKIKINQSSIVDALNDPLVRGLLASVSDGALIIDARDRRIVAMNPRARSLLGYRESDVLGCQCQKMMNSPACSTACPLTAVLNGRSKESELDLYYRGKAGNRVLHAHTRMVLVVDREGEPLAGIELFTDTSEVRQLRKALHSRQTLHRIIGRSGVMQRLFDRIEQIAPYDIPILVTGESGTGKERVVDALRFHSARAERPYLKINCAALSESLVESELFGHRRGAFTGAALDRRGIFEEANGGTLLLDEVGELPLRTQAKLLRVVQEGEIRRIGEERSRRVDVRIIAATNRSLEEEIRSGAFRSDLFYRLAGATLQVPSLAARPEDIPLLAAHFIEVLSKELFTPKGRGPKPPRLSSAASAALLRHPWPGNIRELKNVLRLAIIHAGPGGTIEPYHIEGLASQRPVDPADALESLAEAEAAAIKSAMVKTGGNVSAAARILGINRTTLWRKIKKAESTSRPIGV